MGALGSTVQGLVEEVGFETGVKNSCYRTCEWSLTNQSGRSYVDVTFCNAAFTPGHMSPGNVYPVRGTCIRIHI